MYNSWKVPQNQRKHQYRRNRNRSQRRQVCNQTVFEFCTVHLIILTLLATKSKAKRPTKPKGQAGKKSPAEIPPDGNAPAGSKSQPSKKATKSSATLKKARADSIGQEEPSTELPSGASSKSANPNNPIDVDEEPDTPPKPAKTRTKRAASTKYDNAASTKSSKGKAIVEIVGFDADEADDEPPPLPTKKSSKKTAEAGKDGAADLAKPTKGRKRKATSTNVGDEPTDSPPPKRRGKKKPPVDLPEEDLPVKLKRPEEKYGANQEDIQGQLEASVQSPAPSKPAKPKRATKKRKADDQEGGEDDNKASKPAKAQSKPGPKRRKAEKPDPPEDVEKPGSVRGMVK
jgi:hypothetical protein